MAERRCDTRFTPVDDTGAVGDGGRRRHAFPVSAPPTRSPFRPTCCPPMGASAAGRQRSVMSKSTPSSPLATRSSARPIASRRSRISSAQSAASSPPCSICPTVGRSCSATADRRCSGTSPRSDSFVSAASTLVFGEFSSKFADACAAAPHLGSPSVRKVDLGTHPDLVAEDGIDVYALTHNETSTGVAMDVRRPAGTTASDGLVVVDATSAAGGLLWNPAEVDVYYFAPQKCFASDGGLWLAACSPAAIERINEIGAIESLATRIARPEDRPRQLDPESDIQHAGGGHARDARCPARLDARQRRPGRDGRTLRRVGSHLYAWADAARLGNAVRGEPRASARTSSARSTSTTRSTPTTSARRPAGQRRSSTPMRTASSAGTSCASACSRRSIHPTSLPSRHAVDHVVAALAD